jgi:Ca-activated chloride channel homolog
MVITGIVILVFLLSAVAERLHYLRCKRIERLAFGPGGIPRPWTRVVPFIRVACMTALTWSFLTLLSIRPNVLTNTRRPEKIERHLVVVLDVSPSMKIVDAGMDRKLTRSQRASEVLFSIISRIAFDQVGVSVIAVYTGAMPVVTDTTDMAVIRNILDDLPLDYAFDFGKTKLIEGINVAARVCAKYTKDSATVLVLSDGDTLPDAGMSRMPPSVAKVLIIGLGSRQGDFIDGHQSRQDSASLRTIAQRLGGDYYDANERHLPSDAIRGLSEVVPVANKKKVGVRELALAIAVLASTMLALISPALHLFGSNWHKERRRDNE